MLVATNSGELDVAAHVVGTVGDQRRILLGHDKLRADMFLQIVACRDGLRIGRLVIGTVCATVTYLLLDHCLFLSWNRSRHHLWLHSCLR